MRRHAHTIARLLLSLLLLLQLGGSTAAVLALHAMRADMSRSQCQNHEGVLGHSAAIGAVGTLTMTDAAHNASPPNCEDGGCASHCATALLPVAALADVTATPFVAALALPLHITTQRPRRLDRPPNDISR